MKTIGNCPVLSSDSKGCTTTHNGYPMDNIPHCSNFPSPPPYSLYKDDPTPSNIRSFDTPLNSCGGGCGNKQNRPMYIHNSPSTFNYCQNPDLKYQAVNAIPKAGLSINNKPIPHPPPELASLFPPDYNLKAKTDSQYRFCKDDVYIEMNNKFKSSNFCLQGPPSKKTLKPVVAIAPPYATDYWMPKHAVPSGINDQSNEDIFRSGYIVTNCCGYVDNKKLFPVSFSGIEEDEVKYGSIMDNGANYESYPDSTSHSYGKVLNIHRGNPNAALNVSSGKPKANNDSKSIPPKASAEVDNSDIYEGYEEDRRTSVNKYGDRTIDNATIIDAQVYQYPYRSELPYVPPTKACETGYIPNDKDESDLDSRYYLLRGYPGDVNTPFGYYPNQIYEDNAPSNIPLGDCQKSPEFDEYNRSIFTQIIQPGVYARSEIIEPLNSNIGISWDQQFPPVTCERLDEDNIVYVSHDPRVVDTKSNKDLEFKVCNRVTPDNVYDPRFTGYGTSYRSYIDPLTGRPRFYYDDVDTIRRPNYIIRSNIDHLPWADSYGPVKGEKSREVSGFYNRSLANDAFLRDTIKQRDSLQERYMRKYNATVGWQRKLAPLRRDMGTCGGGCGNR